MTAINSTVDGTSLSGPALRLHLLELYLDGNDMPDQALALAQDAERWILAGMGAEDIPDDGAINWAERREKLLRWWLAGKTVSEMEVEFCAAKSAIHSAAKRYGISAVFRRGSRGYLYYTPVPLDAPLPAEAQQLLGNNYLRAKHKDLLDVLRSASSEGVTLAGRQLAERLGCSQVTASLHVRELIEAGLVANTGTSGRPSYVVVEEVDHVATPVQPQQAATLAVVRQIAAAGEVITSMLVAERLGCNLDAARKYIAELVDDGLVLNHGSQTRPKYALADQPAPVAEPDGAADIEEAAPQPDPVVVRKPAADPAPALSARAMLPEDKLRQTPEAASHVDMETVVAWLRANGCKSLTEEAPGCWSLEGAVLADRDLLKRANKARKALKLPPFSVRGV